MVESLFFVVLGLPARPRTIAPRRCLTFSLRLRLKRLVICAAVVGRLDGLQFQRASGNSDATARAARLVLGEFAGFEVSPNGGDGKSSQLSVFKWRKTRLV
jgi:hypothetical protein